MSTAPEQKVLPDLKALISISDHWRKKSESIVFTNGVFDILHRGHIDYLYKTSKRANRMIIGVNSDASVKRLGKGSDRPYNCENDRAYLLAALGFVDGVIIFNEGTPLKLIQTLKPDVLAKGGDYNPNASKNSPDYMVGSEEVKSWGGRVISIPFLKGFSTTSLVQTIRGTRYGKN